MDDQLKILELEKDLKQCMKTMIIVVEKATGFVERVDTALEQIDTRLNTLESKTDGSVIGFKPNGGDDEKRD